MLRHVGHRRDRAEADDLPHFQHRDPIRLLAERECQILARLGYRLALMMALLLDGCGSHGWVLKLQ